MATIGSVLSNAEIVGEVVPVGFTATEPGLVPASGGGTVNYLCANGQWSTPSGGPGGSIAELHHVFFAVVTPVVL